jgi:NAD(P)H-hydrate epimerase
MSRAEVRDYDRRLIESGIAGVTLMERAAAAAVEVLEAYFTSPKEKMTSVIDPSRQFVVVCGKGNNSGDGFVMARLLLERGRDVGVDCAVDPAELTGDARIAFDRLKASEAFSRLREGDGSSRLIVDDRADSPSFVNRIASAGLLIDALLGTGAVGPPRRPIRSRIDAMNRSNRPIFAIDVPSGLDCDTGVPFDLLGDTNEEVGPATDDRLGDLDRISSKTGPTRSPRGPSCIRAFATVTFVAMKIGFRNPASRHFTGAVTVRSIV